MKTQPLTVIFLILFLFSSCAAPAIPRTVRLYDLNKGSVMEAFIEDARQIHGKITAVNHETGESFTGEYTSIRDDVVKSSYGSGYVTGGPSSLYHSSYGWATAYGFSFDQPTKIYGAATLVGNRGTVIEVVYAVDRRVLHGHGVGRDNQGNRYKLHF
jgi:hypothetical protein